MGQSDIQQVFVKLSQDDPREYHVIEVVDADGNLLNEIVKNTPDFEGQMYAYQIRSGLCVFFVGIDINDNGNPNYGGPGTLPDLRWRLVQMFTPSFDATTGKPFNPMSPFTDYRDPNYDPLAS